MPVRLSRATVPEAIALVLALALVLTFVTPQSFRPRGDPRAAARTDLVALGAALETYRYDTGHYPTTTQGLAALVDTPATRPPNWRGPYVLRPIPRDPWGAPYVYRRDAGTGNGAFFLASYGADRTPGGRGDSGDVTVR